MFRRLLAVFALALSLALVSTPARAAWHKAESDHFVIYSDSSERDIREFSERLERYHVAMKALSTFDPPKPSPSNRVTVYAVGSPKNLRKIFGDENALVGGFYIPRAGGSVAFIPNVKMKGGQNDGSMIILLHEYAHHFTIASSSYAMPRWITEGAAEFFAAVKFARDGGLDIGGPAHHRVRQLDTRKHLTIQQIFDYDRYAGKGPPRRDTFYAQSWLLFHYLMFNEQRLPQYTVYARKFMQGTPSLQAAEEAFGDLDQLGRELEAYSKQKRIPAWRIPAKSLPIGDISVMRLSDGMEKIMDVIVKSRRGLRPQQAKDLLPEAREIAAKFPNDPGVLTALAEAEYAAGNDAEAIAAADKALAIDKGQKNAYVQKGYALFRQANEAEDAEAAYAEAMEPFQALNVIENDHPLPLIYYYRSFAQRGIAPNENARAALERALELAPFDQTIRINTAVMQIGQGKLTLARQTLAPLAADPHSSTRSNRAKRLIEVLANTPDGQKVDLSSLRGPR